MSYAPKQRQIAREAGKSFESVVRDYAKQGYSMTGAARMMGYDPGGFRKLCDRYGWREWFQTGAYTRLDLERHEAQRGKFTPNLQRAIERRKWPTVEYQGIRDTYAGHARRLGLKLRTVYNRKYKRPGDLGYIFSTRSHVKPPPNNRRHPWRNKAGRDI